MQELKEEAHQLRLEFCQQITTNLMEDNEFVDKLWMSVEAHFHLIGYVNRLCGLVVRVSGYRYRGPGFDPRRYQIF